MTLRLLHICQPTDGGAAVVAAKLAEHGVRQGHDVTVASPAGGYLRRWVEESGARWVEVPLERAPSTNDLRMIIAVRRLMREADVVHLHSSKAGAVGRAAASTMRQSRPPVIFTPHGWSWYVGGRMEAVYKRFERWAGSLTDVVTVVSEQELNAGRAVIGSKPRIELITNGVDLAEFAPGDRQVGQPSPRLLVQVGRLSTQKGQDRSLAALARLADNSVRLRFVGDGPDEPALHDLTIGLGLSGRVEFVGSVDPRPHLHAADVVLLPSRWEGMSLVLLEAMASGCAIVAADCGGIEALDDCGAVIPHGNDEAAVAGMATAIEALLADESTRTNCQRRARERAEESFDLNDRLNMYETLWQRCGRNSTKSRIR